MIVQEMIHRKSSYLQYLPPVLWMGEPEAPEFSLGLFLLAFEHILTGLDDQPAMAHTGYQHASLEQTLDELHKLYNPFKVRSQDRCWLKKWLEYLASWVGLELLPDWDAYQKRKLISDAVHIYNLRGRKQGILKALEIYVVSEHKPRIAIDTGESVFRVPLEGERAGHAHVVSSGPPVLHPLAVTIDRTDQAYLGRIIIGDTGSTFGESVKLWRMTAYGELDYESQNGHVVPVPLYDSSGAPASMRLTRPVAIVDDPAGFYVIAGEGEDALAKILRVPKSISDTAGVVWQGVQDQLAHRLVGMARDADGNYVVLDDVGSAKILVITPGGAVARTLELGSVVAPTALTIDPDGDYIVADAGNPDADAPTEIYKIHPSTGEAIPLLTGLAAPARPVFPTALYMEADGHLLILDYGVKEGGQTQPPMMQPAVVWRLFPPPPLPPDEEAPPPQLEVVSGDISYVHPMAMTKDLDGNLLVVDQGDFTEGRDWRRQPQEFGVVLHFTQAFPGIDRMVRAISDLVQAEKPAGTRFWLKQY